MKMILGIALGVVAVWVLLHWNEIWSAWTHRKEISAGGKVAAGVDETIAGVKDFLKELDL